MSEEGTELETSAELGENPNSEVADDLVATDAKVEINELEGQEFEDEGFQPPLDEDGEEIVSEGDESDLPVSAGEPIDRQKLKNIIEGALFAADKPLSVQHLTQLFYADEAPVVAEFKTALVELAQDYDGRGVELKEVSSGYRFQVVKESGPWVSRLWDEKPARYSRALLETLALVAYRQPITRGEIEEIRGVSVSSHIMKTLLERDWVRVVGHRDVPGRPAMYATTRVFLDYFNLKNLDELPSLAEIRDLDKINEELELIESSEDSTKDEPEAETSAETSSNSSDTEEAEETGHNKPKLTLHDIAKRMENLRDSEEPSAGMDEPSAGLNEPSAESDEPSAQDENSLFDEESENSSVEEDSSAQIIDENESAAIEDSEQIGDNPGTTAETADAGEDTTLQPEQEQQEKTKEVVKGSIFDDIDQFDDSVENNDEPDDPTTNDFDLAATADSQELAESATTDEGDLTSEASLEAEEAAEEDLPS